MSIRQMSVQKQDTFLYTAAPPLSFWHSFYVKQILVHRQWNQIGKVLSVEITLF